ncbi:MULTISPECIES: hypothetical protein [Rhodococcus]
MYAVLVRAGVLDIVD